MRSCTAGKKEFFIRYNGDIYPCQSFLKDEYLIDNIMDIKSLCDLALNKDKYRSTYKSLDLVTSVEKFKCKDCKVNLFCWPCPGEIDLMVNNGECFNETCKEIKPILYKEVWGRRFIK